LFGQEGIDSCCVGQEQFGAVGVILVYEEAITPFSGECFIPGLGAAEDFCFVGHSAGGVGFFEHVIFCHGG